ncbi:DUF4268 domain-containing protein [Chryseobacterium sp. A301]
MFSKEEAQKLRKEFWTAFGKSFPRKWILYHTKIKDFSFKFHADPSKARVSIDLEMKDPELQELYYNKLWSLEDQLKETWGSLEKSAELEIENGKILSRFWVELEGVSIYNKSTWPSIFEFFYDKMEKVEIFFYEYEDFIRDV